MCCTSTAALPQACNSYHCTGAVLDGAAIVGVWLKLAVNAGFVCVASALVNFGVTVAASLKA